MPENGEDQEKSNLSAMKSEEIRLLIQLYDSNFKAITAQLAEMRAKEKERHDAIMEELENLTATRELLEEWLAQIDQQVEKLTNVTAAQIKLYDQQHPTAPVEE